MMPDDCFLFTCYRICIWLTLLGIKIGHVWGAIRSRITNNVRKSICRIACGKSNKSYTWTMRTTICGTPQSTWVDLMGWAGAELCEHVGSALCSCCPPGVKRKDISLMQFSYNAGSSFWVRKKCHKWLIHSYFSICPDPPDMLQTIR